MQTPQESFPALAHALGVPSIFLKREDLHPLGSHKGRSIPPMIEHYVANGVRNFVISSSGNAAIAAVKTLPEGCTLKILIGEKIGVEKEKQLKKEIGNQKSIILEKRKNPKQTAFLMEKNGQAKNLRQSTDDTALSGYESLAEELKAIPNLQAVFIPTSSGTTAQALGKNLPGVQIHIVQTAAVHPIAETFDKNFIPQKNSVANAIVDAVAHRKNAVIRAVKQSGGSGWVVSDDEIQKAAIIVKETIGLGISPNSALSIAGLGKAINHAWRFPDSVACLTTGA